MNSYLSFPEYRLLLDPSERDEDAVGAPRNRFDALKAAVRRKRRRPGTTTHLTPLESPQHSGRTVSETQIEDDELTRGDSAVQLPQLALLPATPTLPPLSVNVLQRKKLFLSPDGEPVVGIEEILQLQETSPPKIRSSPLQLIAVPRKVFEEDEVALMPCHSLHYRYVPSLEVEHWKEPIRDRGKNWRDDELSMILATQGGTRRDVHRLNIMSRGPSNVRKGTWRRLDSQRLQIKSSGRVQIAPAAPLATVPASPREAGLPPEVLLRSQGVMISKTYCIVTIYGIGIYGRLYGEGLANRNGRSRFLRVDSYDPLTCRVASLRVTMSDLEWVFESNPEFLAAGKKQTVLKKVISLLYFKYPEESMAGDDNATSHADAMLEFMRPPAPISITEESIVDGDAPIDEEATPNVPVLCISPEEKLNEAARRRLEREELLRREEQERLRLLARLLNLPRRARHRVVCQLHRISGHQFYVSIYHFPNQVRNFLVVAYHPRTSRTFTIAVGVVEAASLSRIFTQPHKWTPELKAQIARALVPKLYLRAVKSTATGVETASEIDLYRVSLAIREVRLGAQGAWLPLPVPSHDDSKREETIAKYKKDGQQELQIERGRQLQEIDTQTKIKVEQLRQDIAQTETTIGTLKARDAALKDQIEDINSGKGISIAELADESRASEKQAHHEARRGYKAARKTIKDELKALQARVIASKRELQLSREHEVLEKERITTKYEKAVEILTQKATTETLARWFDPRDRRPRPLQSEAMLGNRHQRTVLHAGEIQDGLTSIAAGACCLSGRRLRYSVFVEMPAVVDDVDEEIVALSSENDWFQLWFYDALDSRRFMLRLSRFEWLSFSKQHHETQLKLAAFGISSSLVVQRVLELDKAYETTRAALAGLKRVKKMEKKRAKLLEELRSNRLERRSLGKEQAPWRVVVNALSQRVTIVDGRLDLDRCIYRATLAIVSLAPSDASSNSKDDEGEVVECEVTVTQCHDVVEFHAEDPTTGESWSVRYPDGMELVKEFGVESHLEQQMHLEAIAMTLLLHVDEADESGKRKMRFEE